jgi:uncharacterized protein (TIGR00251 family)
MSHSRQVLDLALTPDGIRLRVRVAPRAAHARILGVHDGALKVSLTAPPVDGAANEALVRLLAEELGIPKRAVAITHGHTSKLKTVLIAGVNEAQVRALA